MINQRALEVAISNKLTTLAERVYPNRPGTLPATPYLVFSFDNSIDTYPSIDYNLNINIFDKNDVVDTVVQTLADTIQAELDNLVINTADFNAHIVLSSRDYAGVKDLVEAQGVIMIFNIRVYHK